MRIDRDPKFTLKLRDLCNRLVSDVERSAELEGQYPGIHAVYFVEDFHREWFGHAIELYEFIGVEVRSEGSRGSIDSNPIKGPPPKGQRTSPWIKIIDTCEEVRRSLGAR